LGESPLPYRFIERNRIISGLSRGVLVIEAPAGSGSLATARYALDQNRDVFVVPGNILLNNFKGSHELIRQGATLVVSAHNILESYDITPPPISMASYPDATLEEMLILKALAKLAVPTDVDKIIEITRLEPRIASLTISFLLIKDFIKEVDGKYRI
jgi:DNA processing protein